MKKIITPKRKAGKGAGKPAPSKAKLSKAQRGYLDHCTKPQHVMNTEYGQD